MEQAALVELLAWGGVPMDRRRARTLVVEALDDFPGQGSAAALLAETGDDVRTGAALLAKSMGAREVVLVLPEASLKKAGAHPSPAGTHCHEIYAPSLHSLAHTDLLIAWLRRLPRFDGAGAEDFVVRSAAASIAAAASARGRPRLDTWVTVSGAVREPGTFLVPLGTPIATLIRIGGGASEKGTPYVAGHGTLRPAGGSEGVDAGVGSVVMIRAGHTLARNDELSWDVVLRRADSTCERCGLCDAACPAGVARPALLLDAIRAPRTHAAIADVAACTGCRACETVCPTGIGIGRIAGEVAARARAQGAVAGPARALRLGSAEAMGRRLGIATGSVPVRDARDRVPRVRFRLSTPTRTLRPLRSAGAEVWAGEPIARGPDGECVLAPFRGVVTHVRTSMTIRRRS